MSVQRCTILTLNGRHLCWDHQRVFKLVKKAGQEAAAVAIETADTEVFSMVSDNGSDTMPIYGSMISTEVSSHMLLSTVIHRLFRSHLLANE